VAFDVLSCRGRTLVTTRDTGLLNAPGGRHHVVELLTDREAQDVLALASGVPRDGLPGEAAAIVAECGRWPLAVALCGGMIRRGLAWPGVLQQLRQARIDRIADRHAVEAHHQSVWHAIHVSVAFLPADERQRFLELAVFPPEEATPEAAIGTLWSHTGPLDDWETQELLVTLGERSLVQLVMKTSNPGQQPRRHISLHDLVYDYIKRAVLDAKVLQDQLLAAYRAKCKDGWPTGPNDGYFFQHLGHHLAASGQKEELTTLLLDLEWLRTKIERGLVFNLVDDYDLVPLAGLRPLQLALRLSVPVLAKDSSELPGQLMGRLKDCPDMPVQTFLAALREKTPTPWLCPRLATLYRPESGVIRVWKILDKAPPCRLRVSLDEELIALITRTEVIFWRVHDGTPVRRDEGEKAFLGSRWDLLWQSNLPDRCFEDIGMDHTWQTCTPPGAVQIACVIKKRTNPLHTNPHYEGGVSVLRTQPEHVETSLKEGGPSGSTYLLHGLTSPALSADGRFAVCGGIEGELKMWDLVSCALIFDGRLGKSTIAAVAPFPRSELIGFLTEDGTLGVGVPAPRAQAPHAAAFHSTRPRSLWIFPSGTEAILADLSGDVSV